MIVCSVAACVIQLRHEVSLGAVVRYFTRTFYAEANLERELRSHLTTHQLTALLERESAVNRGGFVYRDGEQLHFYPHETADAILARADQTQNEEVFPRLLAFYHGGEIERLVDELASPALRSRLERAGLANEEFDLLCRQVELDDPVERVRLLRRFSRHVEHFTPYAGRGYSLSFREKLRFYEGNRPVGEYVGTFEVLGLQLDGSTDDEYGRSMAVHSHHLTIVRIPGDRILIKDYFGNRLRTYTVRMIQHPSGRTLYRVA